MHRAVRLRNFYDDDDDEDEGAVTRRGPQSSPRLFDVTETIHMDSDEDDDRGGASDGGAATRSGDGVRPTLEELRSGVAQATREVQRIQSLILHAVWRHTVARRPVDAAARGTDGLPAPTGARGGTATAAGPSTTTSTTLRRPPRDSDLLFFPPPVRTSASRASRRPLLYHERPFLPPSRRPTVPAPDPGEHARSHQRLFSAIMEAGRRGLLPSRPRVQRRGLSAVLRPPTSEAAGAGTGRVDEAPAPSLAVLILRVALERALATLFLRQLRLDTHVARARRAEIALRYDYFRQRRVLRAWAAAARAQRERRRGILSTCVAAWVEAVHDRRRFHASVEALRAGLAVRRRAREAVTAGRRLRLLHRWRSRFTASREARSLYAIADEFRARAVALPSVGAAAGVGVAVRPSGPQLLAEVEAALSHVRDVAESHRSSRVRAVLFSHWRQRAAARHTDRAAYSLYERALQLRCVRRARARVAEAAMALSQGRAALRACVAAAVREGGRVSWPGTVGTGAAGEVDGAHASGRTAPVERGRTMVHVEPPPAVTWRYKAAGAVRIAQARVLRASFEHWRRRARDRRADRLRVRHARIAALRQWLGRLRQRRAARGVLQVLWLRWRVRLAERRDVAAADALCARRVTADCLCTRWRARVRARRARQRALLAACVQRWYDQAALRAAARVLRAREKARLFAHWRQRSARRTWAREAALVADTVRETVVLLSSLRWWRLRAERVRQVRLSAAVLSRLGAEQQLASCFLVWKRKVFGPLMPPPLPLKPPALSPAGSAGIPLVDSLVH